MTSWKPSPSQPISPTSASSPDQSELIDYSCPGSIRFSPLLRDLPGGSTANAMGANRKAHPPRNSSPRPLSQLPQAGWSCPQSTPISSAHSANAGAADVTGHHKPELTLCPCRKPHNPMSGQAGCFGLLSFTCIAISLPLLPERHIRPSEYSLSNSKSIRGL